MSVEGIALCRISSKHQTEGHSLEAQRGNVDKKAADMDATIIKYWEVIRTSKAGKNISRKDLEEILRFCKQNRKVKFLFLDRVNRLMREMMYMIHYIVGLEMIGVKVIFCDPTQQHLNGDDQLSKLMLIMEAFKAEQENVEREQTIVSRMKARYANGYYLSHPHPGYMKSSIPGIHIPDPIRFKLLQRCCRLLINEQYTLPQAIKWLNLQGYSTPGGKRMDCNHFAEFIVDRYYCGIIDIKSEGWPKGVTGLHEPMLSMREHTILVEIIRKRNPRIRLKHNPEFPLGNLLRHFECKDSGEHEKLTGFFKSGKRPSGKRRNARPVYRCRACKRQLARARAHDALTKFLEEMILVPNENAFKEALVRVWKHQRGSVSQRLAILNRSRNELTQAIKETTIAYIKEPPGVLKDSMRELLDDYDGKVKQVDIDIASAKNVEVESEEFVDFAIDFVTNLKKKWWDITFENRRRGEQILFNGKIYIDSSARVHTPLLSTIYRLGTTKKAPELASDAHMVELIQNNWHQVEQELWRWRGILAAHWSRTNSNFVP